MRVARLLDEAKEFGPVAVTIGNFDGVHCGHMRLLDEVMAAAAEKKVSPAVLSFDPHPASIVASARALRLLTTPAERCSIMARHGIEHILLLPFTRELSYWTPEKFVERVLAESLHARVVIVGDNFRFGHNQAGNTQVLTDLGKRFGFETRIIAPVRLRGRVVSSSGVRKAVEGGNVSLAGRLLCRAFELHGEVVKGQGIGSSQTVPTLNLRTQAQVVPAPGVYITRTYELEGPRHWDSITNVGYRPTFSDAHELTIETFLLSEFVPPPPETIRVEFLRRVRDERKFESPELLRAQIMRDVGMAQTYFRRGQKWIAARATARTH